MVKNFLGEKSFFPKLAGATERFLSRGVPINKKRFSKFFLLYKSLILGGVRPPQTPPGPRPLIRRKVLLESLKFEVFKKNMKP